MKKCPNPLLSAVLLIEKCCSGSTKYNSKTNLYYKVLVQNYSVQHSTVQYFVVLQSTTPYFKVLLRTTQYMLQYCFVLQRTKELLQYDIVPLQYSSYCKSTCSNTILCHKEPVQFQFAPRSASPVSLLQSTFENL